MTAPLPRAGGMLTAVRGLLAVVLFAWVGGGLAHAQDDVTERAKARFKEGVAAYEAGRYEEALAAFEQANKLKPHPSVAVNIANCHDKLGHPTQAIHHFERFLELGEPGPEQRKQVVAALKRLRAEVGTVVLHVSPDGAQVVIDGGEPRQAPIAEPLTLRAGAHVIEATLEGHAPAHRELEVKGGGRVETDITLERAGTATLAAGPVPTPPPAPIQPAAKSAVEAAAPPPEPAAAAQGRPIPVGFWIAGGAGAALLAGALVTGLLALDAESEFDAQLARRNRTDITSTDRILAYNAARDAADRAQTFAATTDVLASLGLVGAGIAVYLLLADDGDEHAARRVSLARGGLRIIY